jgi:hypothetical protein
MSPAESCFRAGHGQQVRVVVLGVELVKLCAEVRAELLHGVRAVPDPSSRAWDRMGPAARTGVYAHRPMARPPVQGPARPGRSLQAAVDPHGGLVDPGGRPTCCSPRPGHRLDRFTPIDHLHQASTQHNAAATKGEHDHLAGRSPGRVTHRGPTAAGAMVAARAGRTGPGARAGDDARVAAEVAGDRHGVLFA